MDPAGVVQLFQRYRLGGEMKRVTFYTEDALRKGGKNFLRIRVYKP